MHWFMFLMYGGPNNLYYTILNIAMLNALNTASRSLTKIGRSNDPSSHAP